MPEGLQRAAVVEPARRSPLHFANPAAAAARARDCMAAMREAAGEHCELSDTLVTQVAHLVEAHAAAIDFLELGGVVPLRGGPQVALEAIGEVARDHGLTVADLRAPGRSVDLVALRWRAMVAARGRGCSLAEIGAVLDRDHTTVLHGLRRAAQAGVVVEPALAGQVNGGQRDDPATVDEFPQASEWVPQEVR